MSGEQLVSALAETDEIQPWQAPPVGVQACEPAAAGEPGETLLTAERLAAIEEQARNEGYRAGFEEGRRAGLDAGRDEMQRAAARLDELIDALSPQLSVLDDALLSQLGSLVLAIARQLVRRELRSQPGEVVRVVRDALAALPASEARVRIHLHPDDVAIVREALAPDAHEPAVRLLEDATLTRGGARLETDSSVVDASVEARVSQIAARLLGGERRGFDDDTVDAP